MDLGPPAVLTCHQGKKQVFNLVADDDHPGGSRKKGRLNSATYVAGKEERIDLLKGSQRGGEASRRFS